MLEDRILVWRLNRRDTTALCRVYEKYRDDLLKVAAALLYDNSGIEDVLHDVFVEIAGKAGHLQLRGNLKGFLAICVANRARDHNRSLQRRTTVPLDKIRQDSTPQAEPQHATQRSEVMQRMHEAMLELPEEQRETIVLHLQSRMRFREIARHKGISVNTAMSRYRYGLNKLRSALDGEL
ncbi:MAG: sigma-70 family RNA polymerase sigma factor [Sedimentisphaerales bacterium]|nr:sigma-70 family RNA polymerase sigma factor [Sedimentisphaerales bacterium]